MIKIDIIFSVSMNIIIRKGNIKDLSCVLDLIKELADFENAKHEVKITIEDLKKDGFGKSPLFQLLVAEYKNEIIGLSFYWFRYSTWKGKFLFLEDFIVKGVSKSRLELNYLKKLLKFQKKKNVMVCFGKY